MQRIKDNDCKLLSTCDMRTDRYAEGQTGRPRAERSIDRRILELKYLIIDVLKLTV